MIFSLPLKQRFASWPIRWPWEAFPMSSLMVSGSEVRGPGIAKSARPGREAWRSLRGVASRVSGVRIDLVAPFFPIVLKVRL